MMREFEQGTYMAEHKYPVSIYSVSITRFTNLFCHHLILRYMYGWEITFVQT